MFMKKMLGGSKSVTTVTILIIGYFISLFKQIRCYKAVTMVLQGVTISLRETTFFCFFKKIYTTLFLDYRWKHE
jgi:hypothetical protein